MLAEPVHRFGEGREIGTCFEEPIHIIIFKTAAKYCAESVEASVRQFVVDPVTQVGLRVIIKVLQRLEVVNVVEHLHRYAVHPTYPFLNCFSGQIQLDAGFAIGLDGFVDHLVVVLGLLAQEVLVNVDWFIFVVAVYLDEFGPHIEITHGSRGSLYKRFLYIVSKVTGGALKEYQPEHTTDCGDANAFQCVSTVAQYQHCGCAIGLVVDVDGVAVDCTATRTEIQGA